MADADPRDRALKQIRARLPLYQERRHYYDGDHRLSFATDKFRTAFGSLFRAFALNLCPAVVDSLADRLAIVGVDAEDDSAEGTAATLAWQTWQANRMARRSGEIHQEAALAGDAYAIVWPDTQGEPRIYPEVANTCTVHYADDPRDGQDAIDWAAKCWRLDDGRYRLTMYYPDRVEKYATKGTKLDGIPERAGSFLPLVIEGEPWPLLNPWERVPVFHFANNAGTAQFGRSELTDVMPIQDALNKSIADMLVASEYAAFRQRWATGIDVPTDEATGQPIEIWKAAIERVWTTATTEAKFGEFSAANLEQMRTLVDGFKLDAATVSGIPLHYFNLVTGDFPSGEALKTAEGRLIAKAEDRQVAWGDTWEDVLSFALRVRGVVLPGNLSMVWRPASPRSEKEAAEVAALKLASGVSKAQVLRELGYDEEQVKEMLADAAAEADIAATRTAAMFDAGRADFAAQ